MIIFKNFVIIFIENKSKNIRNLKNERNKINRMTKYNYTPGILDIILIINIILKYFNLIDWDWKIVLWPLWAILIIAFLIYSWGKIQDN